MKLPIRPPNQERRAAEAHYRTLFDYAPDGILIADSQSNYLDANPSICRMLGYTREELIGMHASAIVAPEETPHIGVALEVIKAGSDYHREWLFRRKDGSIFSAEVMATLMPDGNVLGMIRDVTERKQAELRIQHLNRVYAVLSDINQTIVREKNVRVMLAASCRIAVEKGQFRMAWIGLDDRASGWLKMAAYAGATEDTVAILEALLEARGCAFTLHAWQTGHHGVCNDIANDHLAASWRDAALERDYRSMASLPLKAGDKVVGTFNLYADERGFFDYDELRLLDELATDISFALEVHGREAERRQVVRALRESEERLRELAETIQEVFWVTDPAQHRLLYVSPAYERLWGRSLVSLYENPRTWFEAIHPEDRDRVIQSADARPERGEYDETYRIQRPDGTIRWIHDRGFGVRGPDGEILRVVGTAKDITAQRQLEEQFRQAQKMEAIGQLAGGVAHDFNNLLAAIMMQADLAAMDADVPPATMEYLNDIKATSEKAASLTRQLLAFSRRQVMQPRQVDLNETVTSLTKMLQRILGEDVRLQLDLHPGALLTRADPGMLDQVLLNLVVNARDAMPGGGRLVIETVARTVTVEEARAMPDAAPGPHVCLRVIDTGTGIAPEHLARIFEPFFTTKDPGKGTGLGLATVFGIVKQHGGSLTVESGVGRGTIFQILLPASQDPVSITGETAIKPEPRGGTETILLVEDEASVRLLTRAVLERWGYRVLEAAHGLEALTLWEQHKDSIRLLFTDIVMPEGISGRELAARLQAEDPRLRVIFTSGYSADIAGRELTLRKGEQFIQKPSNRQQLLETVRKSLDG